MARMRMLAVLALVVSATAIGSGQQQVPPGAPAAAAQSPTALSAAAMQAEQAGRTQEAFDLYVRAIQALPDPPPLEDDVWLRGRAMSLALGLHPRPSVPEDADRFAVRGQVATRDAKGADDFRKAEAELRKAVRAAPWIPDHAYNLALIEERLEKYRAAAANLKLYLMANPPDAAEVRAKMYALEMKAEDERPAASESRAASKKPSEADSRCVGAPTTPSKSPLILIYVSPPESNGFVDASKDLQDSVKDLQQELKDRNDVGVSPNRESADVLLFVTKREDEGVFQNKWVYTELQAGTFKKEFFCGYSGGPGTGLWRRDAREIIKDVRAWVAANRENLLARRNCTKVVTEVVGRPLVRP
jgi:hypothetical protein